jgi:predicted CDP-diglyceride synthetase/phosphatidate cytidylyltransferase
VFFVINTAIGIVGGVLAIVCIGYLILMLWPFTWLIATIYPLVVAFAAKRGDWIDYPIVGPKVRTEWKPLLT